MYINQQKRNAPSAGGKWKSEQYKRPSTETIWSFYVGKVWGNNPYTIPRYFFTWKLWVIQKVMLAVRACQVNLRFFFTEDSFIVSEFTGLSDSRVPQIGNWNIDWQVWLSVYDRVWSQYSLARGVSRVCSSYWSKNSGVCLTVCGNRRREDPHLKMCYVSLLEGFFLVFFLATQTIDRKIAWKTSRWIT